jgi:DNA-binding beta-propeller fold protein YncE
MKKLININLLYLLAGLSLVYVSCGKSNNVKPPGTEKTIASTATVSTFAGNGSPGYQDGSGDVIEFASPKGLAIDSKGNVFVTDSVFNKVRKITPDGIATTFLPYSLGIGICTDVSDALYISSYVNGSINKVTSNGVLIQKTTSDPNITLSWGKADNFSSTYGIAFDKNGGRLYATNTSASTIDLVNSQGISSPFGPSGNTGNWGIAVDSKGNVFVGSVDRVLKITPLGLVSVYAASGVTSSTDIPVARASFNHIKGIAIDQNNNLYITDSGHNKIKLITPDGVTSTLAGTGVAGFADGSGDNALFSNPTGIAVSSDGTVLYVADSDNNRIRKITIAK